MTNSFIISYYFIDDEVTLCEQEMQHTTNLTPVAKRFCGELETQEHIHGSSG